MLGRPERSELKARLGPSAARALAERIEMARRAIANADGSPPRGDLCVRAPRAYRPPDSLPHWSILIAVRPHIPFDGCASPVRCPDVAVRPNCGDRRP